MQIRKLFPYLIQGVSVGVIIGVIIIVFVPKITSHSKPVVELKEVERQTPATAASPSSPAPFSYADAVKRAAPAVVNIYTTKIVTRRAHPFFDDPAFRRFFGDSTLPPQKRLETSLGSGVIVSEQGYIITNHHVIDQADEILVALHDERTAPATVVGSDPESDLAILKVSLSDMPSITIGHSDTIQVGDVVLAIGNPFGVGQAVSQGIISALGRSQLGITTFENFIQTDAAINPGNSGGALINANGELIGINTAIFSQSGGSQGIGFAIPVDLAKNVLKQIIEQGQTTRGWLGVEIQTLTPALAESFGLEEVKGVVIAGVISGGPADHAKLMAGDIITRINNQQVSDATGALNLIAQTAPETEIQLSGFRDGKPLSLTAMVGVRAHPD
jgi:serine protease DegS